MTDIDWNNLENDESSSSMEQKIFEAITKKDFENTFKDINYCYKKAHFLIGSKNENLKNMFSSFQENNEIEFLNSIIVTKNSEGKPIWAPSRHKHLLFPIMTKIATFLNEYCGTYKISLDRVLGSCISFKKGVISFYGTSLRTIFTHIAREQCKIRQGDEVFKYRVECLSEVLSKQKDYEKLDKEKKHFIDLPSIHIAGAPETWETIRIPRSINKGFPITGIYGIVTYRDSDGIESKIPVIYNVDTSIAILQSFFSNAEYRDDDANWYYKRGTKDFKKGEQVWKDHIPAMVKYPVSMLQTRFGNKAVEKMCAACGIMMLIENDDYVDDVKATNNDERLEKRQQERYEVLDNKIMGTD